MAGWIEELKRRNVIRVALAYLVGTWLILQVADVVLENIGAPDWVMQSLMFVLAVGFIVTLALAWIYELTPEGIRREREVDPASSITPETGHKLDRVIIGLLVLVLAVVGLQSFLGEAPDGSDTAQAAADTTSAPATTASAGVDAGAPISAKSIAVLAFADLSPEGDQAYFAEGISEELLNVLAKVPGLKVAGRTSSFAFKDQNRDLREIGEILDVANILEGSVRTDGQRVRVTAQLIKADDGFHLWSDTYDRDLTDIFKVQDDIAKKIAVVLKATILGDAPVDKFAQTDPRAYENYLKARQWTHTRNHDLMVDALDLLDEALAIDPNYAPALAQRALVLILLSDADGSYGDIPVAEALAESRPLIDRALELDPDSAEAFAVSGLWHGSTSLGSNEQAIADLRRALEINPTLTNAINWLAIELPPDTGRAEMMALYESAMAHDPLYRPAFNNLVVAYIETRQMDAAEALIRRVERVAGESPLVQLAYGMLEFSQGDLADAYPYLEKAWDYNTRASVARAQFGFALLLLGEYERAASVLSNKDRLMALWLQDRREEAEAEYADRPERPYEEGEVGSIGDWLLVQDRADELVALMESQFGGSEEWIDNLPEASSLWGASLANNAALALLETGRDGDARRALRRARQTLDMQRTLGANNFGYWISEAEYAAMTGDSESVVRNLNRAVEIGAASVAGFWNPALDGYRDLEEFVQLEQQVVDRARAARRKLDLPELML